MSIPFYKYQGTGNDFILIDNRTDFFPKNNTKLVESLCHRKFGIGGDGLILLEDSKEADFAMVYYNSDGNQSSMCGNGGRCIVAFAGFLGIIKSETTFMAVDGLHHATIDGSLVKLQMIDVEKVDVFSNYVYLNTGSPHHVQLAEDLAMLDVKSAGAKLRYGKYGESGSNINFVEQAGTDNFSVRTYERGVEDETLSCGTGVTAVAIAMYETQKATSNHIILQTRGGELLVTFNHNNGAYTSVTLTGPAVQVFKGEIPWKL